MTEAMSKALYPSHRDEATLFQAYVLSQAGFRLRIGHSEEDGHLHFILAAECDIYEYPYWELAEGRYYLLDGMKYTVCDPTYVNANVGMTLPDMDNSCAFVLTLK